MHPFEVYKLYLNVKFHFSSKKFLFDYENYIAFHTTYSKFEGSENDKICSQLQMLTKMELLELFVSNLVLTPKKPLRFFLFSSSQTIRRDWKYRIKNIDKYIIQDLEKNIFPQVKNFKDLKIKLYTPPKEVTIQKINSFDNMIGEENYEKDDCFLNKCIKTCYPETISILDFLYFKKYSESFLQNLIVKKYKPYDDYLRLYKYQPFLNFKEIMNSPIIIKIYKDC